MRHSTCPKDYDTKITFTGVNGLADCLTEFIAACCCRERVLDDVYRDRYRLHSPVGFMRKAEVHWHKKAMFNRQFLTDCHVKLIIDELFCEMPRKLWIPRHLRQGTWPPAFIAYWIWICRSNSKSWVFIKKYIWKCVGNKVLGFRKKDKFKN